MKTKSALWYVCAIVITLVSSAAFAAIMRGGWCDSDEWGPHGTGGAGYTYSVSAAEADGDSDYSGGYGQGERVVWTTETATLTAYLEVYAWAEATANPDGESGDYGFANASASGHIAGSPYSPSVEVTAQATIEDTPHYYQGWCPDGPHTWPFTIGTGVHAYHDACSGAGCTEGSDGGTYAHSCADVSCRLDY
jgi:hypothetical protein